MGDMSSPNAARHEFAGALQSALTLDEVSTAFMAAVSTVLPAHSVGMYRLDHESGHVLDVRSDAQGEFLESYEEYGRADDPVLDFVLRQRRPIDSTRAVPERDWEACGARSALGSAGLDHSLEAPLVASGILLGTVNFARRAGDPSFSDDDLVSARIVSEQLGLATERALRFEMTGHRASTMESALDRLTQAVIVTDLDAQVIFRNRAARNDPDLLAPAVPGSQRGPSVEQSIAEAMEEFRVNGKRVHIQSIREPRTRSHRIVKSYRLGEAHGAAVTLVFDCSATQDARTLPAWEVLSKREQEIAQLISEGLTTKQIADRAFISENTVKQHLKRVFAKTDVRNRAELVQMIWASGGRDSQQASTG
jgi:DNA-binding CsgD family transcriptional regulator/GAF domain-containing protein